MKPLLRQIAITPELWEQIKITGKALPIPAGRRDFIPVLLKKGLDYFDKECNVVRD